MLHDPIVALATPAGRSALGLIRLSGRGVFDLAARCLHPCRVDTPRTVFRARLVHPETGEPIDDVVAVCFPAPASFTGDDVVEITTHGGLAAPAAALTALVAAGARLARPGEFSRRAVLNGKMDLLQAEATADLIDAGSPAQRRRALQQLDRGLSGRLARLRDAIVTLEALIAYEIDFPEEDDGPVDSARVDSAWRDARDGVARLLATAPEGERLHEGALVVIAGPPNAGKSSLFNALLGRERAIVTAIPGTTRDAIEAHTVIDGFPFRLVDTAGLRDTSEVVESLGIEVARTYLGAADLVLYCEEHGAGSGEQHALVREAFLAGLATPVVEVRTKADLATGSAVSASSAVPVSSLTGAGLADLRHVLAEEAFGRLIAFGDVEPIVTRARHRLALERALSELEAFATSRGSGADAAVAATHLRDAVGALDELIGVITPDDVLDRVFASFCVGK